MNSDRFALKSTTLDQITFLLHTRGRPGFVRRSLSYFDALAAGTNLRLLVLDASDEPTWDEIRRSARSQKFRSNIDLRHDDASMSLLARLGAALDELDTRFVIPMANDDFYLPAWLDGAVEQMDSDPGLAVVHGHVIFFKLDEYAASGKLDQYFVHPRDLPPVSWLEADTPQERIATIGGGGSHGPSVIGWYALQRTDQLQGIIRHAQGIGLPDAYLEYWLAFYQAVLGKTRMLDRIILARQIEPGAVHPTPSVKAATPWLAKMRGEFLGLLKERSGISGREAVELVDRYLRGVERELRDADSERPLKRIRRHPLARFVWYRLLHRPASALERGATAYPDSRLPPLPTIGSSHPAIALIREWTQAG